MTSQKVNPSIGSLHVIRGIAALIVVIYHAKFVLWAGGREFIKVFPLQTVSDYLFFASDMMTSCGRQCVVTFFLLSAFVIKHSFQKNKLPVTAFYSIRAVRIYIPYVASLLISGLVLYIVYNYLGPVDGGREWEQRLPRAYETLGVFSFMKAMVFLPEGEYFGFNPAYWSLLHEAIFYLLFPIYNRLSPGRLVTLWLIVVVLAVVTGSSILYFQGFFLLGLLLYELFVEKKFTVRITRFQFWIVMLLLFGLVNIAVQKMPEWVPDGITVLIYAWAVAFLLQGRRVVGALSWLADISYSLYLFHIPVLMFCWGVFNKFVPGFSLYDRFYYYAGVVFAVAFAYPAYLLVEKQSLILIGFIKTKYGVRRL